MWVKELALLVLKLSLVYLLHQSFGSQMQGHHLLPVYLLVFLHHVLPCQISGIHPLTLSKWAFPLVIWPSTLGTPYSICSVT